MIFQYFSRHIKEFSRKCSKFKYFFKPFSIVAGPPEPALLKNEISTKILSADLYDMLFYKLIISISVANSSLF